MSNVVNEMQDFQKECRVQDAILSLGVRVGLISKILKKFIDKETISNEDAEKLQTLIDTIPGDKDCEMINNYRNKMINHIYSKSENDEEKKQIREMLGVKDDEQTEECVVQENN